MNDLRAQVGKPGSPLAALLEQTDTLSKLAMDLRERIASRAAQLCGPPPKRESGEKMLRAVDEAGVINDLINRLSGVEEALSGIADDVGRIERTLL